MKKIVDIILDKLNNNQLSDEQIFGFLAYYYSDLEKSKNSNSFIEKYKNEIEKIFAYKEKNKVSYENAKNLSIDIAKNIKNKNLPQIAGEITAKICMVIGYIISVFIILIILLILLFDILLPPSTNITPEDIDILYTIIPLLFIAPATCLSNYYYTEFVLKNQTANSCSAKTRTKKIPKPTQNLQNNNTNKKVEHNTTQEIKLISSPKISKKNKDGKDSNE